MSRKQGRVDENKFCKINIETYLGAVGKNQK